MLQTLLQKKSYKPADSKLTLLVANESCYDHYFCTHGDLIYWYFLVFVLILLCIFTLLKQAFFSQFKLSVIYFLTYRNMQNPATNIHKVSGGIFHIERQTTAHQLPHMSIHTVIAAPRFHCSVNPLLFQELYLLLLTPIPAAVVFQTQLISI